MKKGTNSYRHLECYGMSLDLAGTGRRLYSLMENNGYTVRDLQLACGFSTPQSVYKWINGQSCPTIDHLLILCELFKVAIGEIIVSKMNKGA